MFSSPAVVAELPTNASTPDGDDDADEELNEPDDGAAGLFISLKTTRSVERLAASAALAARLADIFFFRANSNGSIRSPLTKECPAP